MVTAFMTLCSSNREGSLTAPVHNGRYWGLVVSRCGRVHVTLFIHKLSCLAPTLGRQDNLKTILRRQPETPRTTPTKMMVHSNNNGTVCCLFHIGSPLPIQLVTSEVCRTTMGIYASLSFVPFLRLLTSKISTQHTILCRMPCGFPLTAT